MAVGRSLLALLAGSCFLGAAYAWSAAAQVFLVPLGVGMALTALLFHDRGRRITRITGDAGESKLRLHTSDGASLELARGSIEGARIERSVSTSTESASRTISWSVVLHKRDRGRIELLSRLPEHHRDRAEAVVAELDALLANVPVDVERERAFVDDARARLRTRYGIRFDELGVPGGGYRDAGSTKLELSWPMARPLRQSALGLLVLAGIATMATGFGQLGALPGYAFAVVFGLLWLWSVKRLLDERSLAQRVTIDDRELVISEARGERTVKSETLPLSRVGAVDLGWDGRLAVRESELGEKLDALARTTESGQMPDARALYAGISAMVRGTRFLSTGALGFAALVDLETVLGAEVAARTGRDAGVL